MINAKRVNVGLMWSFLALFFSVVLVSCGSVGQAGGKLMKLDDEIRDLELLIDSCTEAKEGLDEASRSYTENFSALGSIYEAGDIHGDEVKASINAMVESVREALEIYERYPRLVVDSEKSEVAYLRDRVKWLTENAARFDDLDFYGQNKKDVASLDLSNMWMTACGEDVSRLYKKAMKLYSRFYREASERAEETLKNSAAEARLRELYQARWREVEDLARARDIENSQFEAVRGNVWLDAQLSIGLLLSHTVKGFFELGDSKVALSEGEREEIEALASAVSAEDYKGVEFIIHVHGHADTVEFSGGDCISAKENKGLSRERAEKIKKYLIGLGVPAGRIVEDWFGNFALIVKPAPEKESAASKATEPSSSMRYGKGEKQNRRVEIRLSVKGERSDRPFFRMMDSAELLGSVFFHRRGVWYDKACLKEGAAEEPENVAFEGRVPFGGEVYKSIQGVNRDKPIKLEDEGVKIWVRLGNAFVIQHEGRCIRVEGCE